MSLNGEKYENERATIYKVIKLAFIFSNNPGTFFFNAAAVQYAPCTARKKIKENTALKDRGALYDIYIDIYIKYGCTCVGRKKNPYTAGKLYVLQYTWCFIVNVLLGHQS